MSAPRRIADAERTATMMDLLQRKFSPKSTMSLSHVVMEEVAPSTGFAANRWADALVLSVWKSNGRTLDGFEVKASKADLKKELSDPTKAEALARYCDTWTLLVWDESILVDGIPESWGIAATVDGEHGRELKQIRKPAKRAALPWPREFVCSMVRNAHQQSPGAAYVARAVTAAHDKATAAARSMERGEWMRALRPLAEALYGRDPWKWPKEAADRDALIRIASERLTQGTLTLGAAS